MDTIRKIKIDIIEGKYKAISAYKIPENPDSWYNCPNCNLKPLVWEFDNGEKIGISGLSQKLIDRLSGVKF